MTKSHILIPSATSLFVAISIGACGGSNETKAAEAPTAAAVEEAPQPEAPMPVADANWTLTSLAGDSVGLANYAGKTVVLEWFSPRCPFSEWAHTEGPLTDLASKVTAGGDVVWLAINSTGKGPSSDAERFKQTVATWNMTHPVLMDPDGAVGRFYGAKTTPHIFIINPAGDVVYKGALDNAPRGELEGEYVNYVEAALADLAAGNAVAQAKTKSYGCGVKYAGSRGPRGRGDRGPKGDRGPHRGPKGDRGPHRGPKGDRGPHRGPGNDEPTTADDAE